VARRVIGGVCLGLDDPSRDTDAAAIDDQQLAEQVGSNDRCFASEPRLFDQRPNRS
jgi:hypothetical protein